LKLDQPEINEIDLLVRYDTTTQFRSMHQVYLLHTKHSHHSSLQSIHQI